MHNAIFNRSQMDPTGSTSWPVRDIVYVAIVGIVMLAAFLEWILWLLAFVYCLIQVYIKADKEQQCSTRFMVVFLLIFFTAMRLVFLPVMVVTLPLPSQVIRWFPAELVAVLQWFAFYTFAGLLTIPWLICIYQIILQALSGVKHSTTTFKENAAPKVVIVMPCYNEEANILLRTIESIACCEYSVSCMHIFLSFDGDKVDELYLSTTHKLGVPNDLDSYPTSIDLVYRGCRVTVSRFKHGGKRQCQKNTFKLIDRVYGNYLRRHDDLFILFIDSDCILDKHCIVSFLYSMELKQGSNRTVLAQTGVITSTTKKHSLITILQDIEYIHGQLFERTIESGCGAVTCLPGALTMFRFSAFRQVSKWYFANKAEQCDDLFDYGKMHLGEDRWLTHLFMISSDQRYQIQMNAGAFCKTEAVQTFKSLLKQRRRWFLGFITNETVMLTDVRLWRRFPFLMIMRLAQNTIRTTALLFFIMVISILTTSQQANSLPIGFIAVSLGLNWLLMVYFGLILGRTKMFLYPLMFVINPFLNWLYMVYAVFTASQRTWGGPRADASKAEEGMTVSEAIEKAALQSDELNIEPETFKHAAAARLDKEVKTASLMPPTRLAGRFRAASLLPNGWFRQENGSGVMGQPRSRRRLRRRGLSQNSWSTDESSVSQSPVKPRRLASIVGTRVETAADRRVEPESRSRFRSSSSQRSTDTVEPHFVVPSRPLASGHGPPAPRISSNVVAVSTPRSGEAKPVRSASTPLRRLSRRLGISPLARRSFTHLAADQQTIAASTSRQTRRQSSEEPRGRRRRRPSVSVDSRGRRRLSKTSPASKQSQNRREC